MIAVLTHHWAQPGKVEAARLMLDGNGLAQSKFPGYGGGRQTLLTPSDASKITTLALWQSNEAYDAWRASPERTAALAGADQIWAKPPETERYEVV
jgi:heme-degrading monooxygenase HmoA